MNHYLAPQAWEAKFRCAGIKSNRRSRCAIVFSKAWSTTRPLRLLDFYCERHKIQATMENYGDISYKETPRNESEVTIGKDEQPRGVAPLWAIPAALPVTEGPFGRGTTENSPGPWHQDPSYSPPDLSAGDVTTTTLPEASPPQSQSKRKRSSQRNGKHSPPYTHLTFQVPSRAA
jgi:hypothetical protein